MSSPLPNLSQGGQSLSSLAKHSIEPLVSIATLFAVAYFNNEVIDQRYSILALLILVITFPGEWPSTTYARFPRQIATSWAIQSSLLLLLGFGTGTLSLFPPQVILLWIFLMPVTVFTTCILLKKLVGRIKLLQTEKTKAVVVGATSLSQKLMLAIKNDSMSEIEIVGFFDDRDPPRVDLTDQAPRLGKITAVADYCKSNEIKNIYITLPMSSHPRIMRLLDELSDTTTSIYFLPDVFIHDLIQARVDILNGIPMLAICETPFLGINGLIKRASDIILAEVSWLFNDAGLIAISAFISPYRDDREIARQIIGEDQFIEAYLSTPISECEHRDPKGLYAKAREGKIPDFTGVSAPYEVPERAGVTLDTSVLSVAESVERLVGHLRERFQLH